MAVRFTHRRLWYLCSLFCSFFSSSALCSRSAWRLVCRPTFSGRRCFAPPLCVQRLIFSSTSFFVPFYPFLSHEALDSCLLRRQQKSHLRGTPSDNHLPHFGIRVGQIVTVVGSHGGLFEILRRKTSQFFALYLSRHLSLDCCETVNSRHR